MGRVCTVCVHARRHDIDRALAGGAPFRRIAEEHSVSEQALRRHRDAHLPAGVVLAHEAQEVVHATDLLQQVQDLVTTSRGILETAQAAKDLRTALLAIRETARCMELQGRLVSAAMAYAAQEPRRITVEDVDREIQRLEADIARST